MHIEIHILQSFAPSCLNRDDTNTPKECLFGGYRRARISSQAIKRSIRHHPAFAAAVKGRIGVRTKLLADQIVARLVQRGREAEQAEQLTMRALAKAGYKMDGGKTAVLLFLSPGELDAYATAIDGAWDALLANPEASDTKAKGKSKPAKDDPLANALKELGSNKTEAADIALFGRMVAESTNMNIEAACQVAHAISTHEAEIESDFFTAVDDLQPKEETGAGMMGVVEYNSACFYRYAAVCLDDLLRNLAGDAESAREAAVGFCRAAIAAIPSGKQSSMAAHNLPSYVQVRVRDGSAPWALTNAFVKPVRVNKRGEASDMTLESIIALRSYDERLRGMYGDDGIRLDLRSSTYAEHSDGSVTHLLAKLAEALA